MIVFDLVGTESHPAYEALAIANLNRQYDFLRSLVGTSITLNRPMLSQEVILALNFHAISCLHANAGQLRPCPVYVGQGPSQYNPPDHVRVPALMHLFVDEVNRYWETADPVYLAAFVLWRLNWIHPFINGNGRTARVVCYFVLCLKMGAWLPGNMILPELIRANRDAYVAALKAADASFAAGAFDLAALHGLLSTLISEQIASNGEGDAVETSSAPTA